MRMGSAVQVTASAFALVVVSTLGLGAPSAVRAAPEAAALSNSPNAAPAIPGDAVAVSVTHAKAAADLPRYRVQPGDLLLVSVWKEKDLQLEVLVRPDGGLSFPLAGEIDAQGMTLSQVQEALVARLQRYIPDPVVSVSIKTIGGNRIYVIGKVVRPGQFDFVRPVDVMQALSLAGGATPFAALNDIVILRRENGSQRVMPFRYGDVERGRSLQQNVLLESGDTVVVP